MTNAQKTPDRLYKYRAINLETSDIFCRQILWFSTPDRFEDRYDCVPICAIDIDEIGFCDHIRSVLVEQVPTISEAELEAAVQQHFRQEWPLTSDKVVRFKQEYQQRLQSVGVYSVCERYNSVVMWSHYADSHSGICLELNPSVLPKSIEFHKIEYSHERPVINLFHDRLAANQIAVGVKNVEWQYEYEWRLVLEASEYTPTFPCAVTLPEGMLTGVILGERVTTENRERVLDWCRSQASRPRIYDAKLDERTYNINRIEVI